MILIITFSLVLAGCTKSAEQSKEKISKPFVYSGYTEEVYDNYTKKSEYVEMSDGVKIAVDIYLPADGPKQDSFPVILQYTPYGRSFILPKMTLFEKIGMKYSLGTWGPVLDRANSKDTVYGSNKEMIQKFIANGYVYICADIRGTGASFGVKRDFMPEIATDGAELIDWIADQSWSNGNVGMFGGSYLGYSQLVTAGEKPAALKAIFPEVVPLDGYTGEIRPGGVFLQQYSRQDTQTYFELNNYLPDKYVYPTTPVIDEDGDGEYDDEIPRDLNGNGSFLDDYKFPEDPNDPPQYADGEVRDHIYYLATYEHKQNIPYNNVGPQTQFIDSKHDYGEGEKELTAYDVGPANSVAAIMKSDVAIYNHGSWMDPFVRGTNELYSTLKDTNPSKMIIDVGYHETYSPFWKYLGEDEDRSIALYATEMLRFFDRYLKGIQNGIDTEPPIYIYNMNGDGWRFENEFPLAREVLTDYYFGENSTLSPSKGAAGSDKYLVNFEHDSSWPSQDSDSNVSRWVMTAPDEMPIRTEMDKLAQLYTTAPVTEDTEVTGYPIANLSVSSTAPDGDFYIYLEDIDETGEAVLVTEGVLRAGFSKLFNNDNMINGGKEGINVLPELPWHGYEEKQYDKAVFSNNKIVKLTIDLFPTSWVFKKGHSIRVSIAASNSPTFEISPTLSSSNDPKDSSNIVPTVTIYRDAEHQSMITLPIIPSGGKK